MTLRSVLMRLSASLRRHPRDEALDEDVRGISTCWRAMTNAGGCHPNRHGWPRGISEDATSLRAMPVSHPEQLVSIGTGPDTHVQIPHGMSLRDVLGRAGT